MTIPFFHQPHIPYTPPLLLNIPRPLVLWLMADLSGSPGNLRAIGSWGFLPKPVRLSPREESTLNFLADAFHKNIAFRHQAGNLWKAYRKERLKIPASVDEKVLAENWRERAQKWGFAFLYWYGLFSERVALQRMAAEMGREAARDPRAVLDGAESSDFWREQKERRRRPSPPLADEQQKILQNLLEAEKSKARSLREQVRALEQKIKILEKTAETLKGQEREWRAQRQKAEEKVRALSGPGHALESLQKKVRTLEHALEKARRALDESGRQRARERQDLEYLSCLREETEKILDAFFKIRMGDVRAPGRANVLKTDGGKPVLVLSRHAALPAAYFLEARERGLALAYRRGFKRDPEFEKAAAKSSALVFLLESWRETEGMRDVLGHLKKSGFDYRILPFLPPAVLFDLLTDKAPA